VVSERGSLVLFRYLEERRGEEGAQHGGRGRGAEETGMEWAETAMDDDDLRDWR